MAEEPSAGAKGGSKLGFLGRKLGPLPVWAWGAIGFAGYWWYTRKGPGAKSQQAQRPGQKVTVVTESGPTEVIKRTVAGRPPVQPSRPNRRRKRDRVRRHRINPGGRKRTRATYITPGGPQTVSQGDTGLIYEGPVYGDWVADEDGQVPEPMQTYAPMTAGDIYASQGS